MKKVFVRSTLLASLALTSVAYAQEPASSTAAAQPAKKATLQAGLFYGTPQGDFKELQGMDLVGASPGVVLAGGYEVIPKLSIMGMLHYYAVSSEVDGLDQSMWDIGAGARYAHPISPVLQVYGEAYIQRASYSAKISGGSSADSSGFGVVAGGGILYALNPNLSLGGGLSYSTASLKPEQGDSQSAGWLGLNAFAAYHL
jgi:hypothetical protein